MEKLHFMQLIWIHNPKTEALKSESFTLVKGVGQVFLSCSKNKSNKIKSFLCELTQSLASTDLIIRDTDKDDSNRVVQSGITW